MPRSKRTSEKLKLPDIVQGSWTGEIVGSASIHFGQVVQPGPPPTVGGVLLLHRVRGTGHAR